MQLRILIRKKKHAHSSFPHLCPNISYAQRRVIAYKPVSKPIKPLNAGVSPSASKISLLATHGDFGGRPPPVILVSFLNSVNSFLAMLWRFFHLSFTSVTVRLAVPTAFTAWVISSHSICFFLLVTAFVNLDWIKSRFFLTLSVMTSIS